LIPPIYIDEILKEYHIVKVDLKKAILIKYSFSNCFENNIEINIKILFYEIFLL